MYFTSLTYVHTCVLQDYRYVGVLPVKHHENERKAEAKGTQKAI